MRWLTCNATRETKFVNHKENAFARHSLQPTGGPRMCPEVTRNTLQMADLSTTADISKIVDDDL